MHGRWSQSIVKSKKISIYNKFLRAIMKTYKVKDQEEAVKNAKLFYDSEICMGSSNYLLLS